MSKKLIQAAAGAGGESVYVEDVFSTYVYDSTHGTSPIVNGINLADEGGMVWFKHRTSTYSNILFDTERGTSNHLVSNTTAANATTIGLSSFNTDGFSFSGVNLNVNSDSHVAWTFRKQAGFFDVVTYTGTGTTRTVSHNLGSTPAVIIIKRLDAAVGWPTYHEANGNTGLMYLNTTAAKVTSTTAWGSTSPTDTEFTVGTNVNNISGGQFVAYLFASDDQSFGDNSDESIIKCGSYTGTGTGGSPTIDLGWEPQWLLVKNASNTSNWYMLDIMRGWAVNGVGQRLFANSSTSEYPNSEYFNINPTGFTLGSTVSTAINTSGETYIYIAIRRPMKTPESGTEVFSSLAYTGDGASTRDFDLGMTVDAYFQACRSSSSYDFKNLTPRLTGKGLYTAGTGAEFTTNTSLDVQEGLRAIGFENTLNQSSETYIINAFKRATGFFDAVAYSGTSTIRQQAHNLGVTPEFVIVKGRDFASHWYTYHTGQTGGVDALHSTMRLNLTEASFDTQLWKNYDFNASTFSLDGDNGVNGSAYDYIAYLFATLDGVSKVGSYSGTGSNVDVDCGFSAGARFILIKRTDSTGDWYVWDSARGIVAGNDPYLLLNSTAAEVTSTDYIDPLSSGFTVTSSAPAGLNASGGSYIFLAIA